MGRASMCNAYFLIKSHNLLVLREYKFEDLYLKNIERGRYYGKQSHVRAIAAEQNALTLAS